MEDGPDIANGLRIIQRVVFLLQTQSGQGQMSGIAALAAAAAATQKITTSQPGGVSTPTSGVKVVTPTIVTPSGIKVTPVQGRPGGCLILPMRVEWHISSSSFGGPCGPSQLFFREPCTVVAQEDFHVNFPPLFSGRPC